MDKYEQEPSRLKSGGSFADYDSVLLYQDDVKYLGEVMVDGEEQPSPVSVLDTPFQDEDHSPRAVNKSIVSLKGWSLLKLFFAFLPGPSTFLAPGVVASST